MIAVSAILAIPALAAAQETTGRYATHDGTSMVREMPGGSKVRVAHSEIEPLSGMLAVDSGFLGKGQCFE